MKKSLTYRQRFLLFEILGYLTSCGIPVVTAFCMFPPSVLAETSQPIGLSIIITAIISISVLRERMGELVKDASALKVWIIVLAITLVAKYFVDQLLVISLVGVGASAGATPLFNLANTNKEKDSLVKAEKIKVEIEAAAKEG